jgi:hypothetical protein
MLIQTTMTCMNYTTEFCTLPCSPHWPPTYANKDYQPDEAFSMEKRAEFIRQIKSLLEIVDVNIGLTKLEINVNKKKQLM